MIEVDRLSRSYGDFKAVDDVSFRIGRGEVVGLLGHNGAGKTTIMKMLTGYLEPSAGRITIDGLDIAEQRQAVQQRIGYLPENRPLYPEMGVVDYLEFQAALHGMPELERPAAIREAISILSRGYRQRMGVAQAILHRPRILILDEPTNGLDPSQIQHMRELIRDLAKNATIILSTHILQEVQAVCDRVLIIRTGRLALDARLSELSASRRLRVAIDRAPEQARGLLGGFGRVEHLESHGERHHYALELNGEASHMAPEVACTVLQGGCELYALQPEVRDLESVFGEINRVKEAVNA